MGKKKGGEMNPRKRAKKQCNWGGKGRLKRKSEKGPERGPILRKSVKKSDILFRLETVKKSRRRKEASSPSDFSSREKRSQAQGVPP